MPPGRPLCASSSLHARELPRPYRFCTVSYLIVGSVRSSLYARRPGWGIRDHSGGTPRMAQRCRRTRWGRTLASLIVAVALPMSGCAHLGSEPSPDASPAATAPGQTTAPSATSTGGTSPSASPLPTPTPATALEPTAGPSAPEPTPHTQAPGDVDPGSLPAAYAYNRAAQHEGEGDEIRAALRPHRGAGS